MSRPSDAHFDEIDDRVYRIARLALTTIDALDADYVLVGGWAVYTHIPRVPSVDVDLFVARDGQHAIRTELESEGLTTAEGGEVELLDLDADIELWGIGDPDLGIPVPSFRPADLFENRVQDRPLDLQNDTLTVTVPTPPALALTKVVALRNRDLAYRAHHSGHAGMLLGPTRANRIRNRAPSYYLRKAGKDLFDLGLLLDDPATASETKALLADTDLSDHVPTILDELASDTLDLADDVGERVGTGSPMQTVREALSDGEGG